QRQLTSGAGRATSPAWGPDSRQLVYAGELGGRWRLMFTVAEGAEEAIGEVELLPPEIDPGNQVWPVFDDEGVRIAFSVWGDLADPQTADLYLLDFELPQPLTLRAEAEAEIAWSWLDNDRLLVSIGGEGDVRIAALDVNTGEIKPLAEGGTFNAGPRPCPAAPAIPPPLPPPPPTATPTPTLHTTP